MSLRGKPRELVGACTYVVRVGTLGAQHIGDPQSRALVVSRDSAHLWLSEDSARDYIAANTVPRPGAWLMPGACAVERARP